MIEFTPAAPPTRDSTPLSRSVEPPFVSFGAIWLDRMTMAAQWHGEWLRFVAERWRKDLDTFAQLAGCRSVAEVLCVQFEVAADTASDYLREAEHLLASMNTALQPDTNTPTGA